MQINDELLRNLEKLSHLHIDETKKEEVKEQLSNILNYIENLNDLDTSSLDKNFSTLEGGTPLREDIPREDNNISKDILENAPEHADNFFIVPAIIE